MHVGYADEATQRDIYGHLGPVVRPSRSDRTVADLAAGGVRA